MLPPPAAPAALHPKTALSNFPVVAALAVATFITVTRFSILQVADLNASTLFKESPTPRLTIPHRSVRNRQTPPPPASIRLPPPLVQLLPSPRPPVLPPPRQWTRPAVLAAHVLYNSTSDTYSLSILTTGIHIFAHRRFFKVVACQIGSATFPPSYALHGKIICHLPHSATPAVGDHITVVLAFDARLQAAMAAPITTNHFRFEIFPGDVYPLSDKVSIHPKVAHIKWSPPNLATEKRLMAVASNITWQTHLIDDAPAPDAPRHELCMMTAMKQYPYLLPGWFRFYRRLGVDKFYIYDNDAVSDLAIFNSPFVEVVYWQHERSQPQAFSHFLLASTARCKFAGFFDADEYVTIGDSGPAPLKRYVQHKVARGIEQINFIFLTMHNNGYTRIPAGELPELYTKRDGEQELDTSKLVLDVDAGWDSHTVHQALREGRVQYLNMTLELAPKSMKHNAMLVHYTRRSWKEYVMKQHIGSASPVTKRHPNTELKLADPKGWYLKPEDLVEWTEMREWFQRIMKDGDNGTSVLTWMEGRRRCWGTWSGPSVGRDVRLESRRCSEQSVR